MNKNKKKLLSRINIVTPLVLFLILLFTELSENVIYLMMITLLIGWAIPYSVLLITGLSLIKNKNPKLALIFNIVNTLLCIMIITFTIKLYDNNFLILLIEYIIISIISIINSIYFIIYIKNNPNKEFEEIKKIKKENNGAIV